MASYPRRADPLRKHVDAGWWDSKRNDQRFEGIQQVTSVRTAARQSNTEVHGKEWQEEECLIRGVLSGVLCGCSLLRPSWQDKPRRLCDLCVWNGVLSGQKCPASIMSWRSFKAPKKQKETTNQTNEVCTAKVIGSIVVVFRRSFLFVAFWFGWLCHTDSKENSHAEAFLAQTNNSQDWH